MMDGYDGRDGSPLEQVDTQVRRWLRGVRLSVIAIVLEAIRDELESRTRAVGSRKVCKPALAGRLASESTHGVGRPVVSECQHARSRSSGDSASRAGSVETHQAATSGIGC